MNPKLKYLNILLIPAACVGVTSCDSDVIDNGIEKGEEVRFSIYEESRADLTVPFDKFVIYGDMQTPGDNLLPSMEIFNKTEIVYKDGTWTYEGTQYWIPKFEHSFVAVSPLTVVATENTPLFSNSHLSFTYTIPTTGENKVSSPDDVVDIVAATHRRLYHEEDVKTPSTTTLRFGHVMSKINLSASFDDNILDEDKILEFHQIEFSGFNITGKFDITPAALQSNNLTDDRVINVTEQSGSGIMNVRFNESVKVQNNGSRILLFDEEMPVIMLPQNFAEDSEAKVVLTYSIDNSGIIKQVTIPLKGQKWETGKSYTYKFTITRTGIYMENTSMVDWEFANVGNVSAH